MEETMKVLLAEDDEDLREMLKGILSSAGYEVVAVGNGQLLLDRLASSMFDVVLTDNIMPVKTGLEALQLIRANDRFKALPVVVYTTNSKAIQKAVEEELGGILLSKPANHADLIATIEKAVAGAR